METLKFVHLFEVDTKEIITLMNNETVGRQLPLLRGGFSEANCQDFLKAKKQLWDEYGYGPWAFLINDTFAGWGGIQAENGEADFALILHPDFWGWGRKIFNKVKNQAFNQMGLKSITILFPPSRQNSKAITRIGFVDDGKLNVDGEVFLRFRLKNPNLS